MLNKPQHILILCSRLDTPGGIERTVVKTSNLFAEKGYRVTLLVADTEGLHSSYFRTTDQVQLEWLNAGFGITEKGNPFTRKFGLIRDIRRLGQRISLLQPDIIIASEYHLTIAMMLTGGKKKAACFAWEHLHYKNQRTNRFWTLLKKRYYPRLNGIICLNETEAEYYTQLNKTFVVPNFIEPAAVSADVLHSKNILTVGWLAEHKGIDLVPEIAGKILSEHPDWTWTLVGDGPLKSGILRFAAANQLQERIILIGPDEADLEKEYKQAALFVLLSRAEAFPMVLLEAMAYGVPAISFDCPSGPAHIINHKTDGILVANNDTKEMYLAINDLINSPDKRYKLSIAARENMQRFRPETIMTKWNLAFSAVGEELSATEK